MLHTNILIPEQVLQLQILGFLLEAITRFVLSKLAVCSCVGDHERRHYDYIVSTYKSFSKQFKYIQLVIQHYMHSVSQV